MDTLLPLPILKLLSVPQGIKLRAWQKDQILELTGDKKPNINGLFSFIITPSHDELHILVVNNQTHCALDLSDV